MNCARIRPAVAVAAALLVSACNGSAGSFSVPAAVQRNATPLLQVLGKYPQIEHVVVIVQENRSVDNLFPGFPGAYTRSYGYDENGDKITLQPVPLEAPWGVAHNASVFFAECDGQGSYPGTDCKMDGFDKEAVGCGHGSEPKCPNPNPPYSYVPHRETRPYFTMGERYVFGDEMYESNFDESSFVSHQYLIAAQADSTVNYPDGAWGCEGGSGDTVPTINQQRQIGSSIEACFNYTTLGDELDGAGLSWRYYTAHLGQSGSAWNGYQAVNHIFHGPDWGQDIITPQTQFFSDVSTGNLPIVSWITPTPANSDHAGSDSNTGPDWVASLVNAIGKSQYWDSTVIFVFWDDPGGWYDHVPPQLVDYDGLGMRVPFLIISPYAKQGYVSHLHYETGSILRFIEQQWGLASLSASDARAKSPAPTCFQFSQRPRAFKKIPARHGKQYFLHQPLDTRPPDEE